MSQALGSVPFPPRPGQVMAWDGTKFGPATALATLTAVAADAATTSAYGFNEAQANALVAAVNQLIAIHLAQGSGKSA